MNIDEIRSALARVLNYARSNDYAGYNKYDALDSPILSALAVGNKYLRLIFSQVIARAPLNLRPLFKVPQTRNPKGVALFAMTYLNLYAATRATSYLKSAEELLKWLIDNQSAGFPGMCWGYQYPWQDVGFFAPHKMPNRVVTYFVGSAFLDAYELTGNEQYLECGRAAAEFLLKAPKVLYEDDQMLCLSYVPDARINWIVMDVSALTGAYLARISKYRPDDYQRAVAKKLIHFVVDKQTDYGAWFYTHPPSANRLKMHDNYHTGYILDAILDYTNYTSDQSYVDNYLRGLRYYQHYLFLPDGTPKWMNNQIYPIDVHGSAQGVITFLKASRFNPEYRQLAYQIASWAIQNMQSPAGFFYYQKTRFFKKPFTIMHWSNGWMARALSELIREAHG